MEPPPPGNKVNFDNIQVEDYNLPFMYLEHTPSENAIVVSKSSVSRVWRKLGEDCKDEFIKAGDVIVNPAGIPHSTYVENEVSFTILRFKLEFISRIALESINSDRVELLPHFSQPDPLICSIAQRLSSLMQSQKPTSQMYIDQLSSFFAVHLLEDYCSIEHQLAENNYALSLIELRQIIEYIDANLDKKIRLVELGNLVNMSSSHFLRLFKKSTGITPAQYLINQRLEKATHLLESTNLDLALIAKKVGFYDHSHLCRIFKNRLSTTPDQYRRN